MSGLKRILLALLATLGPAFANAHEIRPAFLDIEEAAVGSYQITWKQPTLGDLAVHLVPHLSNGWLERTPVDQYLSSGFLIRSWKIVPDGTARTGSQALAGVTLTIEGLEDTITDAFVRVRLQDGTRFETLVRPQAPSVTLAFGEAQPLGAAGFFMLGVEHILSGPDHLLFVLGLLLIVRNRLMLVRAVSGFTLAHSLTLACATLGQVSLPSALIEALIALSILFLAPEVLRARQGGTSFTIRYPWAVAFLFGLLHGLGFAGGLSAAGLERGEQALVLLLFNTGVEAGQLVFIAAVLLLQWSFRLTNLRWPRAVAAMPGYLIGVPGAAWAFQRSAAAFGW